MSSQLLPTGLRFVAFSRLRNIGKSNRNAVSSQATSLQLTWERPPPRPRREQRHLPPSRPHRQGSPLHSCEAGSVTVR